MSLYRYKGIDPTIGQGVFIAPSAVVLGRVSLAENSSVWFNAVVRGDVDEIRIGKNTNVQDLSMLHVTQGIPLVIGNNVTLGHSVTLHSCVIEDNCLIGMGATILDNAVIGEMSLVAAGSLVSPGKKFPPRSFIVGSPAVLKRTLTDDEVRQYSEHYKTYLVTKANYEEHFQK